MPAMLPEIAWEELSATLDAVAQEVLAEAGIRQPPVDALAIARALGITVAWDDRQPRRGRYVRLNGRRGRPARATILARPDPRSERRHWTVAHEIGEHVAHRVFAALGVDPRETAACAREDVSNQLASRLLLPTLWFAADGATCGWGLSELKARYATASHELVARRMLEMSPPVIVSIFDQGRLAFRRSNLPGRVPRPSASELACWQIVHRRNCPHQMHSGLQTVRGWPVHEDDWKREILRTEVDEEPCGVWDA
jgi:hypothetical protein